MSRKVETVLFFAATQQFVAQTCWRPLADVYRSREGWVVKFELPGVGREDVQVVIQGCRLMVSGIRRDWVLEQGCAYHAMEIPYGRFERTVELPCGMEPQRFQLEFRDGLLLVRVATEGEER